jgi:putrescine aminotransferase
MITMAKGLSSGYLPISATVISHEIIELLREKDSEFFHGFTYSGHPTCAAVALRNIEIIEREGLVKRVAEDIGPYFSAGLQKLRRHAIVGETRSLGLIGAVEIVRQSGTNLRFGDKEGKAGPVVRDRCIANGLMVRAVRDSIVVCPPLIITRAEVDKLVAIFDQSLTEAAALLA